MSYIRNLPIRDYVHMFNAGYFKDNFCDDVKDLLDYIGHEYDDNESHIIRELQQEYDALEGDKKDLEQENKQITFDLGNLQEKLRVAEDHQYKLAQELKWMKAIPEVRDAIAERYWEGH